MYIQAIYASYNGSCAEKKPVTTQSDGLFCILTTVLIIDKTNLKPRPFYMYLRRCYIEKADLGKKVNQKWT